ADRGFGLLGLFQADGDPTGLEWAIALQERQDELFWDESSGGWFSTTGTDPSVLLRMKEEYDGAEPTASSMGVLNLLVLAHLVEDARWTDRIDRTLRLFAGRLEQMGRAVPMMSAALSMRLAGVQQIVIVEGESEGVTTAENVATDAGHAGGALALRRVVESTYLPFAITVDVTRDRRRQLAGSLPLVAAMTPVHG